MEIVINTPTGEVVAENLEAMMESNEAALPEEDFFEGEFPLGMLGQSCREFELGRVSGVPEVKTVMEKQCKKVAGVKICVRVPVVYTRTSTAKLFTRICVPSATGEEVWSKIRDCALTAIVTGGLAAIIANPAAAIPTAKASMIACLKQKALNEIANNFEFGLYTRQEPGGEWQRRT